MSKMKVIKEKNKFYLTDLIKKIKLEPATVIKLNLNDGEFVEDVKKVIDTNDYHIILKESYKRLKRPQTKLQLTSYFLERNFLVEIVNLVINKLEEQNYINDLEYAKNYIALKSTKYGPRLLKEELTKKGIDKKTFNKAIKDYDEETNLKHIIKREKDKAKFNSSFEKYLEKLYKKYVSKGFNPELLKTLLCSEIDKTKYNELKSLEKDYNKIFLKEIIKEKDKIKLKYKLKLLLLKKGYDNFNINIIEEELFNKLYDANN